MIASRFKCIIFPRNVHVLDVRVTTMERQHASRQQHVERGVGEIDPTPVIHVQPAQPEMDIADTGARGKSFASQWNNVTSVPFASAILQPIKEETQMQEFGSSMIKPRGTNPFETTSFV